MVTKRVGNSRGIAIIYPSTRSAAYSSLFYRYLRYQLTVRGIYAGTVFIDSQGRIVLERPRNSFTVNVGAYLVSLPYEVMYRDYVSILLQLGLNPWRRSARDDKIIVAGGPAVTGNPLPVLPLVDAVLIGEVENVEDEIYDALLLGKRRALESLSTIRGLLVPGYTRGIVKRNYVPNLDIISQPFPQGVPEDVEPVWGRSYAIEVSRGCGRGCRFCLEGFIFRPKRDLSYSKGKEHIDYALAQRYSKVSFYSLSFFDNPHAERILEYAVSQGMEASVPSLRADTLTQERLDLIARAGQRTLTIAPETGSRRVCRAIRKNISSDIVYNVVDQAVEAGIRQVKLYLIIGFPGETENDIEDTAVLIRNVASRLRRSGGRIKVSINQFVPKPVTPLQWAGFQDYLAARRKIEYLAGITRKMGGVASYYDTRWARIQTVLARGDSRLASLIVEWSKTSPGLGGFRRAAKNAGVNVERYLSPIPIDETPPWHRIVEHPYAGIKLLRLEYQHYLEAVHDKS